MPLLRKKDHLHTSSKKSVTPWKVTMSYSILYKQTKLDFRKMHFKVSFLASKITSRGLFMQIQMALNQAKDLRCNKTRFDIL
jgi:hypothetical protein